MLSRSKDTMYESGTWPTVTSICCSFLFLFLCSSADLLHHLSQIYLPHYSVTPLWPCQRIEKIEGIITCHLTDNGIPWSFHPFTFQGFVYKTTVSPVLCIFSPCIMSQSADVCSRNVSFISVQGKQGGDRGVIILMFSSESPLFLYPTTCFPLLYISHKFMW